MLKFYYLAALEHLVRFLLSLLFSIKKLQILTDQFYDDYLKNFLNNALMKN